MNPKHTFTPKLFQTTPYRWLLIAFLLLLGLVLWALPIQASPTATITVDRNHDVLDAAATCADVTLASLPGPDDDISFREALCAANTNIGPDTINFNIPGGGPHTISLLSALPQLVDDATTIDGYSQPGAAPATASAPANIRVALNGTGVVNNGLNVTSSLNLIRGIAIYGFGFNGIYIGSIYDFVANDNIITGNYLGMNASGVICTGNGSNGVFIAEGAQNNQIGGDAPADRNLASCNGWEGISIHGEGTTGNIVSGNYIGTDPTGTLAWANTLFGVRIYGGAQNNTIGGGTAEERNLISGNIDEGVAIVGAGTNANTVSANFIGTTANGAASLPNGGGGVVIRDGAQSNTIGGPNSTVGGSCSGACNLISGNGLIGLKIEGGTNTDNVIQGNYIGVDVSGTQPLGNIIHGVVIQGGAYHNMIGGENPGEGNVISANGNYGLMIYEADTDHNWVAGNFIGTDARGNHDLGNGGYGVIIIDGPQSNTIGPGNQIAYNNFGGIFVSGSGTTGNMLMENSIFANENDGIRLDDGGNNNMPAPNILATLLGSVMIQGTAQPGSMVELFASPTDEGQGHTFLGWVIAEPVGTYTLELPILPYPYLTATATHAVDGTSEFSAVFESTVHFLFLPVALK